MRKKRKPDIKAIVKTAVTLLITTAIAVVCVLAAPSAISKYRRGEAAKAVENGRLDHAVELLLPELERDPKDTDLRLEITGMYITLGNYSRAEYLLAHGMRELAGQVELYRRLCEVYVMQDKLYDAVTFLNTLSNPLMREALYKDRPQPPEFDPQPGAFREHLAVSMSSEQGNRIYVSIDGSVPSVKSPYTEPLNMTQGVTQIRAVAVGPDGLVSDWADGSYKLDDVLEPVEFEDAEIEKIARGLLNMPTGVIISDKLQTITSLDIPEPAPYRTLNDLRFFTHLESLALTGDDEHVDISALAGLSELASLKLNNFGIDSFDLETVEQMTWLKSLDLSNNNIVSLDSLKTLGSLESLTLQSNNILDMGPLSRLISLHTLMLNQNAIEDTSPIAELTGLKVLRLGENRVRGLSGLAGMTALTELDLSGNSAVDISYVKNLSSLQQLNISSNKELANIAPLGQLANLTAIIADGCCIETVEGLAPLTNLKTLSLNENALKSLAGLEGAVALSVLWADKNEISSLRALTDLANLTELHVEHNKLPSLVAIKDLPSIKKVFAFGNPITENVTFREGVTVFVGR